MSHGNPQRISQRVLYYGISLAGHRRACLHVTSCHIGSQIHQDHLSMARPREVSRATVDHARGDHALVDHARNLRDRHGGAGNRFHIDRFVPRVNQDLLHPGRWPHAKAVIEIVSQRRVDAFAGADRLEIDNLSRTLPAYVFAKRRHGLLIALTQ